MANRKYSVDKKADVLRGLKLTPQERNKAIDSYMRAHPGIKRKSAYEAVRRQTTTAQQQRHGNRDVIKSVLRTVTEERKTAIISLPVKAGRALVKELREQGIDPKIEVLTKIGYITENDAITAARAIQKGTFGIPYFNVVSTHVRVDYRAPGIRYREWDPHSRNYVWRSVRQGGDYVLTVRGVSREVEYFAAAPSDEGG